MVDINGVKYFEGQIVKMKADSPEYGVGTTGEKYCRILIFNWDKQGLLDQIGIYCEKEDPSFHSMSGKLDRKKGYYLTPGQLFDAFTIESLRVEITKEIQHTGKPLIGRKGSYICPVITGVNDRYCKPEYIFIETDEYVSGGSGDGLGKTGHCVCVPVKSVKFEKSKLAQNLMLK